MAIYGPGRGKARSSMNTPSVCCTGCSCAKNCKPSPTTNRCIGRSWTTVKRRTTASDPGALTVIRSRTPFVVGVARRSTGYVANFAGGIFTSGIRQIGQVPGVSERWSGCMGHQYAALLMSLCGRAGI